MNRRDFIKSVAAGVGACLLDSSLKPLELLANVQQSDLKKYLKKRYSIETVDGQDFVVDKETGWGFLRSPLFGLYTRNEANEELVKLNGEHCSYSGNLNLPSIGLIKKQMSSIDDSFPLGLILDTSIPRFDVWCSDSELDPHCPKTCHPSTIYQASLSTGEVKKFNLFGRSLRGLLQPVRYFGAEPIQAPFDQAKVF